MRSDRHAYPHDAARPPARDTVRADMAAIFVSAWADRFSPLLQAKRSLPAPRTTAHADRVSIVRHGYPVEEPLAPERLPQPIPRQWAVVERLHVDHPRRRERAAHRDDVFIDHHYRVAREEARPRGIDDRHVGPVSAESILDLGAKIVSPATYRVGSPSARSTKPETGAIRRPISAVPCLSTRWRYPPAGPPRSRRGGCVPRPRAGTERASPSGSVGRPPRPSGPYGCG